MIAWVLLFYLLSIVACIGAGHIFWIAGTKLLGITSKALRYPSGVELGISGLFCVGMVAMTLHFFVAISQAVVVVIFAVGFIAGVVFLLKKKTMDIVICSVLTGLILLFATWGAEFALFYDSGLYHLQAIKWLKEEPIVIGLANLHDRLGFNSIWFSVLAVFWLPFYGVKGVLLATYLPAIFCLAAIINHLVKSIDSDDSGLSLSAMLSVFILAGIIRLPELLFTGTTNTDLGPNVLTLLAAVVFVRAVESEQQIQKLYKDCLLLWVLALLAIMTKLSAIIPGLLATTCTLMYWNALGVKFVWRIFFGLTAVLCVWFLRNVLISGCLVFPVGFSCLDIRQFEWSVGSEFADQTRVIIERWAKSPGPGFMDNGASEYWFQKWMEMPQRGGQVLNILREISGIFLLVLACFMLLFFRQQRQGLREIKICAPNKKNLATTGLILVITITGLVFGFVSAPDPRFWWATLVLMPVIIVVGVSYRFFCGRIKLGAKSAYMLTALLLASSCEYLISEESFKVWRFFGSDFDAPVVPLARISSVEKGNLKINFPLEDDRCWLAPKPCSPYTRLDIVQYQMGRYLVFTSK